MKNPRNTKKEMHVYDQKQLNTFYEAIKDKTIYIPVILASTTGIRLGELCGLRWENVDITNGFIQIKEQLQEENKKLLLVPLKTTSSRRKIILLDDTIDALKELQCKQESNKSYFGDIYNDSGFVVCQNDGTPYHPTYISRNFRRWYLYFRSRIMVNL